MSAYLIFLREGPLHSEAEMAEYRHKLRVHQPESSKLVPRVFYGTTVPLEGKAPDGIVMFEFPSIDDATAWYNSEAYQEAVAHRRKAGEFRVLIVEGISIEAFMAVLQQQAAEDSDSGLAKDN